MSGSGSADRSGRDRVGTLPTVHRAQFPSAKAQRFIVCVGGDVTHHPSRRVLNDHIQKASPTAVRRQSETP